MGSKELMVSGLVGLLLRDLAQLFWKCKFGAEAKNILRAVTARLLDNRAVARHAAARDAIAGFLGVGGRRLTGWEEGRIGESFVGLKLLRRSLTMYPSTFLGPTNSLGRLTELGDKNMTLQTSASICLIYSGSTYIARGIFRAHPLPEHGQKMFIPGHFLD